MKAELSIKLLELMSRTTLANAWWQDDQGGALYQVMNEPFMEEFYKETGITSVYRKVAKVNMMMHYSEKVSNNE